MICLQQDIHVDMPLPSSAVLVWYPKQGTTFSSASKDNPCDPNTVCTPPRKLNTIRIHKPPHAENGLRHNPTHKPPLLANGCEIFHKLDIHVRKRGVGMHESVYARQCLQGHDPLRSRCSTAGFLLNSLHHLIAPVTGPIFTEQHANS